MREPWGIDGIAGLENDGPENDGRKMKDWILQDWKMMHLFMRHPQPHHCNKETMYSCAHANEHERYRPTTLCRN